MAPGNPASYQFDLMNSRLYTLPLSEESRVLQFLDQLSGSSSLHLAGSIRINKLRVADVSEVLREREINATEMEITYNNKRTASGKGVEGQMVITAK